jgi:hypothetical protein
MVEKALLEFILEKLDKVDEKLNRSMQDNMQKNEEIRVALTKQSLLLEEYNHQLSDHIRRTNLLEKRTDQLDDQFNKIHEEKVKQQAVESFVSKKKYTFYKVMGLIIALLSAAAGVLKLTIFK